VIKFIISHDLCAHLTWKNLILYLRIYVLICQLLIYWHLSVLPYITDSRKLRTAPTYTFWRRPHFFTT